MKSARVRPGRFALGRVTVVLCSLGLGVGAATAVGAAALAADPAHHAITALHDGPAVYVAPNAVGHPLTRSDLRRIRSAVDDAASPFFVAVLGEPSHEQAQSDPKTIVNGVVADGTYVVVGTGGFVAASDLPGVKGQTGELVSRAIAENRNQAAAAVTDFVGLADADAATAPDDEPQPNVPD